MSSLTLRLSKLLTAGTLVAAAWLVVLPWIARQPAEQAGWEALQRVGIDPSAMYYTELEAMEPILQRLNANPPNESVGVPSSKRHPASTESVPVPDSRT